MTDKEVQNLIEEFRVPPHVRRHGEQVAKFAVELGEKLISKGEKIDLVLLKNAALLHDVLRVVDFKIFHPSKFNPVPPNEDMEFWTSLRKKYVGLGHEEATARILEERGFAREAEVIRKHRFIQILSGFNTWEEKILYYADKRTKHDKLVTLEERLSDGRERNVPEADRHTEAQKKLEAKVYELEKEILGKIGE